MKGGIVQISWHGSDPILSVDFHSPSGLLATAGADRDIKLWALNRLEKSTAVPTATFKANLSYHNAAVNVVRFSPSGELLASGADGGEMLIWKIVQVNEEIPSWKVWKTLRFHHKDVLDLEWSPDGIFLVSGSVDNTCIIWNVMKGTVEQVLADHQHYVQGVTWDPAGKYVASLSGDRTCRIYSLRPLAKKSKVKEKNDQRLYTCQHVLCKKDAPGPVVPKLNVDEASQKQVSCPKQYLFFDENMPSFFRRLAWSPDGSFLLIPSGVERKSGEGTSCSVSYIVSRQDLSRPALQLPAASKPVVAARFCPVIFSLNPKKSWKHDTSVPDIGAFKLPYRLVFAVATLNSIFIYDTEQSCPIAIFGGLHYAPITDLAWSSDAKFLAVSSQDGYCTLVGFDEGDLGLPIPPKDLPPNIAGLRLSSAQENTSLSISMNTPEQAADRTITESGDFQDKAFFPKKDSPIKAEQSPVMNSKKSPRIQSDSQVKSLKVMRITPKPILEYLQPAKPESKVNSGALYLKECISSDDRCDQTTSAVLPEVPKDPVEQSGPLRPEASEDHLVPSVPRKITRITPKPILEQLQQMKPASSVNTGALYGKECQSSDRCLPPEVPEEPDGQPSLVGCGLPCDERRSEVVQESSELDGGLKQAITPACQTLESAALLHQSITIEAKSDICQDEEDYKRIDLSRHCQGMAESPEGPSSILQGPYTLKSLKDLLRSKASSTIYAQKPQDQQSHMYVRPLKFRRISPNLISDDTHQHDILKPISGDATLVPPSGCPGVQRI